MSSGRIPAWKRLGLELKSSNSNDVGQESVAKRKRDPTDGGKAADGNIPAKRAKSEVKTRQGDLRFTEPANQFQFGFSSTEEPTGKVALAKYSSTVSSEKAIRDFNGHVDDTDSARTGDSEVNESGRPSSVKPRAKPRQSERASQSGAKDGDRPVKRTPKKQKKAKGKKKGKTAPGKEQGELVSADPPAYIAYLESYSQARESWKFNKAHQTKLLNNLFHLKNLPPTLDAAIVDYVSGLQSYGAREHLRTSAYKASLEASEESSQNEGSEEISAADIPAELRRAEALSERLSQTKRRLGELSEEDAEDKLEEKRDRLQKRLRAEQVLLALSETDKNIQPRAPVVARPPPPPPRAATGPRERKLPPTAEDADNAAVVQGFNKVTGALGSVTIASKKIVFDNDPDPMPAKTQTEPVKRTRLRKKRTGLAALTGVPDGDDTSGSSSDNSSSDSDSDSSSSEGDSDSSDDSSSSEESSSDED